MPATRRANGSQATPGPSAAAAAAADDPTSPTMPAAARPAAHQQQIPTTTSLDPLQSPYLPTATELLLLSAYPITLVLGSLFSHLSPLVARQTTSVYSHTHQSFQPQAGAPSYFAKKRNLFNILFVKIGWFWCTVALLAFVIFASRGKATRALRPRKDGGQENSPDNRVRRRWQVFLRYALATLLWIAVTQWFLGPSLVDRFFSLTGGVCEAAERLLAHELDNAHHPGGSASLSPDQARITSAFTHIACKAAGGTWAGGYDISGHVFILVLGSGMLWAEMLPFFLHTWPGVSGGRTIRKDTGAVGPLEDLSGFSAADDARAVNKRRSNSFGASTGEFRAYATTFAFGVAILACWMLLMTAAFFHTWAEKTGGCVLAFVALYVVYMLPRALPALRSVLGMPGV